jgi:hypothetical protein
MASLHIHAVDIRSYHPLVIAASLWRSSKMFANSIGNDFLDLRSGKTV